MREKPILFSGPMVRAILAGKTQTRRIVKPVRGWGEKYPTCKPEGMADPWCVWWHGDITDRVGVSQDCPYGKPGDRLWVRETLRILDWEGDIPLGACVQYAADGQVRGWTGDEEDGVVPDEWGKAKVDKEIPSIFMPRWASRITLEIADVRVERLNDISEADAIAEGTQPWEFNPDQPLTTGERAGDSPFRSGYAYLWDCINDHRATWKSNPWVWCVSFRRVEQGQVA